MGAFIRSRVKRPSPHTLVALCRFWLLLTSVLVGFMALYTFAVMAFVFFNNEYTFPDHDADCSTLLRCLMSHWYAVIVVVHSTRHMLRSHAPVEF